MAGVLAHMLYFTMNILYAYAPLSWQVSTQCLRQPQDQKIPCGEHRVYVPSPRCVPHQMNSLGACTRTLFCASKKSVLVHTLLAGAENASTYAWASTSRT